MSALFAQILQVQINDKNLKSFYFVAFLLCLKLVQDMTFRHARRIWQYIFSAACLPEGSETTIHITASYYSRYIICPPYLNSKCITRYCMGNFVCIERHTSNLLVPLIVYVHDIKMIEILFVIS